MVLRLIPSIVILFTSCMATSKTVPVHVNSAEHRDVIALSYLIRDYLRQTNNADFIYSDIVKFDTLGRVTNNFSSLEVSSWPNIWRGGYAVYFKFSANRNLDSIELIEYERIPRMTKTQVKIGRNDEQLSKNYDGEIHFYYPERLYHIVEIILRNDSN